MEKHFLEQYKTQDKPEVKNATERKEQRTGEKGIFQDRSKRIDAYIERLENVFLNPDQRVRERNIDLLKPVIHENTIIKAEDFPESYFEHQRRELTNRGLGDIKFNVEDRRQEIASVQEAQSKSLDAWIDHLSSDDSNYPADIKYFAMQGILKAGVFDTDNYRFDKRVKSTTAPFYQIDHEALSMTLGALEAYHHNGDTSLYHQELLDLIEKSKDFGSMYASAMRSLDQEADKDKALEITNGAWRVFKQGSDPQELVDAFAGKRAYLCLGNIGDASGYLEHGDVQVYFSNNRAGQPTWPRVAIAIKPDKGAYEIRGTYNKNEDIDPEISQTDIIKSRLALLPNGESFAQKDADMKLVTALVKKQEQGEPFTKDEIIFIYEMNSLIFGFGFDNDPRVKELRKRRDPNADMLIFCGCAKEQVARSIDEINEDTRVYVGKLVPGIFEMLPERIEYIYTSSFPESRVVRDSAVIGGKTVQELERDLLQDGIRVTPAMHEMMNRQDFTTLKDQQTVNLIRLNVGSLGLSGNPSITKIYETAKAFGLELCPAEVGASYRYKSTDSDNRPVREDIYLAMKKIIIFENNPCILQLMTGGSGKPLYAARSLRERTYNRHSKFMFYYHPSLREG